MLGSVGSLSLTSKLSHQMNMIHLTKGQIKMINLTKPYGHPMWPIWLSHNHFDGYLFKSLTWHLVKKVTLIKCTGQM